MDGIPSWIGNARLSTSGPEKGESGMETVARSRSRSLLKSRDRSQERRLQCSKEVYAKRSPSGSVVRVLLQNGGKSYGTPSRAFSDNCTAITRILWCVFAFHSLIFSSSFEGQREHRLIYTYGSHKTNYRSKIHNGSHNM